MKETIDAVFSIMTTLAVVYGAGHGLHKISLEIKKAALAKAAHGLPPLVPFVRKMTEYSNANWF